MEHIGFIIKELRTKNNMTQQQIADLVHMHRSNYSRVEKGERDLSIESIKKVADYFTLTIDELVSYEGGTPKEVVIEDKGVLEQVKLIAQLDEDEKNVVFKMIDAFLTKKKFKEFFKENMAS
ncbi:helix-turn-helix domain-containing protein [Aquimarina agarivorans]|uniref:helix-turn-helix domain-containing protein n=1 Tax=Aquimarina agarivorans TaxID=980584 RepID=UPI000248EAA7|nr:helix-turn-helix transcriptional regulator [Aquimarina agarivorans]